MSADSEEHVRYVVAGMPTGWAAMSKTIREVDEDKVKDYKEDIDTLLVFTGLFSAVLTAFVIVSYTLLSPDPQDTVVQYLAQISAQTNSYTVIGGTISSTVPPLSLSSSPFAPSLPALRINYLWFASLIITLITASLSILVKQWLREYLAFDYTSPHERLRARQFRYPGLSTWKVYQIAGVLPLLLQLALALFFLGICFFTRSVDHGIGDMCTVLVSLWAACFVTATIAPVISPRCPYKTALLKNVMTTIRPRLRPIIIALTRRFRRCVIAARRRLQLPPYSEALLSGILVTSRAATSGAAVDATFPPLPARELSFIEEAQAIKLNTDELSMLAEVDAFLLDDDLLGTTMLDSLTQSYVEPSALIKFVLQAISLRLKGDELRQPLSSPPDLRRLPKRAWIAVSDIVAAIVKNGLQSKATTAGSWVQDAIFLLLSVSEQPFTPSARSAILRVLQNATLSQVTKAFSELASSATTAARFLSLLEPMATRFYELLAQKDAQPADVVAFTIHFLSIEARFSIPALPLTSTLDLQLVSEPIWQFSSNLLAATIEEVLGPDSKVQKIGPGPWLEDAVHILLSPSSYPLTFAGNKALGRACLLGAPYQRIGTCIRRLAPPDHNDFAHTLSRLHGVLQQITMPNTADWFLKEIVRSIPCTARCRHPMGRLALLVSDHALGHDEWMKHFTLILVERVRAIPMLPAASWPPASGQCLRTLMSLPLKSHLLNLEIPEVVFALICHTTTSASVLRALVSVEPEWRSYSEQDPATCCVISLFVNANTEGRQEFTHAIWNACNEYLSEEVRAKYRQYDTINLVRHVDLARKIHANVQSDKELSKDWTKYYTACAKAMSIFRATKYPTLPDKEKDDAVRLAEECVGALDTMEPATADFDEWEADFDVTSSVFPDAIFQELVEFVVDRDAVAQKSKRVRRLRKIGVIPGGMIPSITGYESADNAEATESVSPEHAERVFADQGGDGLGGEDSMSSARSVPLTPAREIEDPSSLSRNNERGRPGDGMQSDDGDGPGSTPTLNVDATTIGNRTTSEAPNSVHAAPLAHEMEDGTSAALESPQEQLGSAAAVAGTVGAGPRAESHPRSSIHDTPAPTTHEDEGYDVSDNFTENIASNASLRSDDNGPRQPSPDSQIPLMQKGDKSATTPSPQ